ncbi:MAG: hypothetical protein HY294_15405 [Candidatus Rokubacteria bacterium]|nr:hypothetical protein [Candidatus Rokubacteria bacterium]MBI3827379.1 hypothetical protein [Candidatus Rokubacteria bacterium]
MSASTLPDLPLASAGPVSALFTARGLTTVGTLVLEEGRGKCTTKLSGVEL